MNDFGWLTEALASERAPVAVVDLDALDHNIDCVRQMVPAGLGVRLVAKSLASLPLIDHIAARLPLTGMMVFSESMTRALLDARGDDLLCGKPLPVASARAVLDAHPQAQAQVQWLIDTPERLEAYAALDRPLRVALEVDVGLHRGGFDSCDQIARAVARINDSPLTLTGLMGYEAHLAAAPGPLRARARRASAGALTRFAALMPAGAMINTGGSLTFAEPQPACATEVALGSALVLPSDFANAQNAALRPALWIAAPVLKRLTRNRQPVLDWLRRDQIAIQGGYWMADPAFPVGARYSRLFGRSTNHEVWDLPRGQAVQPGDWAVLRPHQSEAVLHHLGRIAAVRGGRSVAVWPALPSV